MTEYIFFCLGMAVGICFILAVKPEEKGALESALESITKFSNSVGKIFEDTSMELTTCTVCGFLFKTSVEKIYEDPRYCSSICADSDGRDIVLYTSESGITSFENYLYDDVDESEDWGTK